MQTINLEEIEKEYKNQLNKGEILDADKLIELSLNLYCEIKAKDVFFEEDEESDMLLFQYGEYNWKDEHFFKFNITRQFIKEGEYEEPYQLSISLLFTPIECKGYNSWSVDFDNLEKWSKNIKETEGYKSVKGSTCKKFEIVFDQC